MKKKVQTVLFLMFVSLLFACSTGGGKKAATQTVFQPVVQVVTRNYQPVFTSTAPDVAGINLAYNYNFTVLDFDAGPQPITLAVNAADTCGGALTDNGDGTGNYTFTPTTAQLGTQCVVGLTASDGEALTNQNTTVDIGGINAPPYFTSTAPVSATESALYTYNITVADDNVPAQALTLTKGIFDTCGGTLTDNGNGTGTYSFTPTEYEGGTTCLIALIVTDSISASADQNSLVTIAEDNKAPWFTTAAPTAATESILYSYAAGVNDTDFPFQTLTCSKNGADTCGGALIGCAYGFTPTELQGGTSCVVGLTVSDGALSVNQNTTVNIAEDNKAPSFTTTAPTTATEGILYNYVAGVTDPDNPAQILTCSTNAYNTCGGTLAGCSYSFTPSEMQGGASCTVGLTVTDGSLSADQNSLVAIAETNTAPSFTTAAPTAATESILYSYAAGVNDTDFPFQTLTCSKNGADTCGGALIGFTYGFTPTELQGGTSCVVGLTVSDGALSVNQNTTVNIAEDNKAPSFTTTAPTTATEGILYNYVAGVTDPDNPAQILTCSTNAFNTCGGTLAGCSYSFTPSEMQGGASCTVGLTVTDGSLSADQNSLVAIAETNTAPSFTSTASAGATEGILYSYTATVTDPDIPAQALICSKNGSDTCGGALAGCTYTFTPSETMGGTTCIVGLSVSDGALNVDQNSTVTVSEANQAPVWSAVPANLSVASGQTFNSTNGAATDADLPAQALTCSRLGSTCSFTVTVGGSGVSPLNCAMSFTAATTPETCNVDVQVSDGAGGTITRSVMISVQQCRIFVNDDAAGADNGSSWTNAFTAIQDAVDASWASCEIWAAEGDYYKKTAGTGPVLTMKDGVRIFGGFLGIESSLAERLDPADYPTVLDGEDTSYHVVVGESNARLDGFYITGGYEDTYFPSECGGGMYNSGVSNLIITNNIFDGNWVRYGQYLGMPRDGAGGGIYNDGASPTISNCSFSGNNGTLGSGIYNFNSSSPTITNCSFSENTGTSGGGIQNSNSSPTITNCSFWGNVVDYGGGILNYSSSPVVTDCSFWGNVVAFGGGIDNEVSSPLVTNCSFSGNSTVAGGGIYNFISSPTIINCTFNGNSAGDPNSFFGGGGIYNYSSSPVVTDCEFSGNSVSAGGGINNDVSSSPTITNCVFWGNSASSAGGIKNYYYSSPTITNCTFSGNSATSGGLIINTDYSSPTITNSILWGNSAPEINNINSSSPIVTYSDVQGGYAGTGNINANPLFVSGTYGDFYLSQMGSGQPSQSPCVNKGSDTAANLGLDTKTTQTNNNNDNITVDMGYHYRIP